MKLKLIEYPFGKDLRLDQETVWLIQGSSDNGKTWMFCFWNTVSGIPTYVASNSIDIAAYRKIKDAYKAFDKIAEWYREQATQHQIKILREVEIETVKRQETVCENDEVLSERGRCEV